MTLELPVSISLPNLVQIGQELAKIHPFVYLPRWRPPPSWICYSSILDHHYVPVAGLYVTCQWRNDQLEFIPDIMILPFHDFGWKMPIPANFGGFWNILTF